MALLYWYSESSADSTGVWFPCCAAQFLSYPALEANQPLQEAR